jgi:Skp family chaperone for outer membrane proteins
MKKIILILGLFTAGVSYAQAQETQPAEDNAKDKIEALYVAYITKELNLTSDEAQKFWPIHTEFDNEIKAVKKDLPELDRQQLILNIKKRYQPRFSGVLGTNRTENFFRKDLQFRQKLAERLRKIRQNQANKQRPFLRRGGQ